MSTDHWSPVRVALFVVLVSVSGCLGIANPGSQNGTTQNSSIDGLIVENYDANRSYDVDVFVMSEENVLFWKSIHLEPMAENRTEGEVDDGVHLTPSQLENATGDLVVGVRVDDRTDGEVVRTSELDVGQCHRALVEIYPEGHIVFGTSCINGESSG
jgi:hypothetical protein